MTQRELALGLVKLGIPVFKVRVAQDGTKTPMHKNGHLDAALDPGLVDDWFTESPSARVGAFVGAGNLLAVDIDTKNGKDGWDSLDKSWLEVPSTFSYQTPSGGTHLIYSVPGDANLAPSTNYRGMVGVDIRAGSSWVLWNGDVPASRDEFAPAPEWAMDKVSVKTAAEFEGSLKEWFDTLEPGEPNVLVRGAISRIKDDMGHADMVAATYEAIRLGAEGNPGVPTLLEALEEAWESRDPGNHTTPEEQWEFKFHEALTSGIEKFGAAIELRGNLPPYSLSIVPKSVPDNLVVGDPGDKETFRKLLAELTRATDDDYLVTSVLWNSPRTRDLAREWGLEFVHKRVQDARTRPEPVRENPTLAAPEVTLDATPVQVTSQSRTFLTDEETANVLASETFVDRYVRASAKKGFWNPAYDVPAAWTALSMAVGTRAVLRHNGLGANLWFIEMGGTGTGKSSAQKFLKGTLDLLLRDEESYYNVGASSSPAAIHEELLMRDDKASMIHHDEAASFFSDLHNQDWSKTLEHHFSSFYDGEVEPSNKIRLPKELRGKRATTSFNLNMSATPDKLLSLVTTEMFESGFLSRVNWTWAPERPDTDDRFDIGESEVDAKARVHPVVYELVGDLLSVGSSYPERVVVSGSEEARKRIGLAAKEFDKSLRGHERYETLRGPLTRLTETMVKCAALLALYRGETTFELDDAVTAVYYGVEWFETMIRVVNETSESEFSRDASEIESYIKGQGGSVSEAKLLHRFRNMIRKSPRELEDRIAFLRSSGRINRRESDGRIVFDLNG